MVAPVSMEVTYSGPAPKTTITTNTAPRSFETRYSGVEQKALLR